MNILEQKINHPKKGPLELRRWNKTDLANLIMEQNRVIMQQYNQAYWYRILYGFNHGD